MDIEGIEIKARMAAKQDVLDAIVNDMPDCLKKRMRVFINTESKLQTEILFKAREENDFAAITEALYNVRFLARLADLQEELHG